MKNMPVCAGCYLADVYWSGGEGNWSDWHRGANELFFSLFTVRDIFLTRLYPQFDFGEQSLRAWSIAWWGQETKLSMSPAKQKMNPDVQEKDKKGSNGFR